MNIKTDIKAIISYFASYDPDGKSPSEIDTFNEYIALGEYLNGIRTIEKKKPFKKLSSENKTILQDLYANISKSISAIVTPDNTPPKITGENLKDYFSLYNDIQYSNYDNKQKDLELLYNALKKYTEENHIDISHLGLNDSCEDLSKIIDFLFRCDYINIYASQRKDKALRQFKKPYDNSILKKAADNYITKNKVKPLVRENYSVDLGNGEFDKVAVQKEGNCWLHAGINALRHSDKGLELLKNNRYYDASTGIFVIHLQEAEDNGLHDGIYIITPEDIAAEAGEKSIGEGDITAYVIAVSRYFEEVRKKKVDYTDNTGFDNLKLSCKETGNGNATSRIFEVLTGGKTTPYDERHYNPNIEIQEGVGAFISTASISFEEIYDIIQNNKGVVVGAIGNILSAHALSFIGVKNGKILVQESNNKENFDELYVSAKDSSAFLDKSESIGGAYTFEISKENFIKYVTSISIIKWNR